MAILRRIALVAPLAPVAVVALRAMDHIVKDHIVKDSTSGGDDPHSGPHAAVDLHQAPPAKSGACNDGYNLLDTCFDVMACAQEVDPVGKKYALAMVQSGEVRNTDGWLPNLGNFQAQATTIKKSGASVDLMLLLPDSLNLTCTQQEVLKLADIHVRKVDWSVPEDMLYKPPHNWCGPQDFIRLHTWGLEGYDAVAYYDQDIEFQGNVEPVLKCASTGRFLSAAGPISPLNLGFFALKPDLHYLEAARTFLRNEVFDATTGWGKTGFLPLHGRFIGAECGQGLFSTLLFKTKDQSVTNAWKEVGLRADQVRAHYIDPCIWNYNGAGLCPKDFDCGLVQAHHKPGTGAQPEGVCSKFQLFTDQRAAWFASAAQTCGASSMEQENSTLTMT